MEAKIVPLPFWMSQATEQQADKWFILRLWRLKMGLLLSNISKEITELKGFTELLLNILSNNQVNERKRSKTIEAGRWKYVDSSGIKSRVIPPDKAPF